MAKQIHVRLEDALAEALTEYTEASGQSAQDFISNAIMQLLSAKRASNSDAGQFTFIDLFAGIGGMRLAFEQAGGSCVYSNEWNKYCAILSLSRLLSSLFLSFVKKSNTPVSSIDEQKNSKA